MACVMSCQNNWEKLLYQYVYTNAISAIAFISVIIILILDFNTVLKIVLVLFFITVAFIYLFLYSLFYMRGHLCSECTYSMCISACSENANIGAFFTLFLSSEIVILLTFLIPKVDWSLQLMLEHFQEALCVKSFMSYCAI